MSALATIVGGLGDLSESELRQLYLMIGVRLGIPDVPPGAKPRGRPAGKSGGTQGPSSSKTGKKATSSKGNPKRKSQWANHPLYQEYSRLKKVVESQAKEAKTSFNAVDTPERRAYTQAFSQWLEAKSSFRDHRSGDPEREGDEEESSEEEDEAEAASSSQRQVKPASPPPKPTPTGKTSPGAGRSDSGKPRSPSGKGKAPSK